MFLGENRHDPRPNHPGWAGQVEGHVGQKDLGDSQGPFRTHTHTQSYHGQPGSSLEVHISCYTFIIYPKEVVFL